MKKRIYLTSMVLIWAFVTQAQWQTDVRLTNNVALSYNPCITASATVVHVVWEDNRDGNYEIYYKRSNDGGVSWLTDTRLTNDPAGSSFPAIASSGANVHLVWIDNRDGNYEIYYMQSTDGGVNWSTATQLTNNVVDAFNPSITVSGTVVHVVWEDNRDGNYEIYYKRSNDGGISWLEDSRLTTDPGSSDNPSITSSGTDIHVVWMDNRDGNKEIYYIHSTDGGVNWTPNARLTNNSADSYNPSIAVLGIVVHVVWEDNRDGNREIYYKHSIDGGINWSPDTRLTDNTADSYDPCVTASGTVVHVVWEDFSDGNWEIYYMQSTNEGANWSSIIRLTDNIAESHNPFLTLSGTVVHVVWEDHRDGNFEIYYKQNPTGNPVSVENINSEIPKDFQLCQNFPNPFNPRTTIKYQLPELSYVTLKVYDLLGKEIATIVYEEKLAGNYEVEFSATGLPSGVYFYQLKAGSFLETKKMIMNK